MGPLMLSSVHINKNIKKTTKLFLHFIHLSAPVKIMRGNCNFDKINNSDYWILYFIACNLLWYFEQASNDVIY